MKAVNSSFGLVTVFALIVSLANTAAPVLADQRSFLSEVSSLHRNSDDLQTRLNNLRSYEDSSTGIDAWTKDASAKLSTYDAIARAMTTAIGTETAKLYPNPADVCKSVETEYSGPYGSELGFFNLSLEYGFRTSELGAAVDHLNQNENKLLAAIADFTLNNKPVDRKLTALLASTRAALKTLAPQYQRMAAERDYLRSVKDAVSQNVYGAVCGRKPLPTPSPSPTPKRTPTPVPPPTPRASPTPKATSSPVPTASHCPGGQVYFPGLGCRNNPN